MLHSNSKENLQTGFCSLIESFECHVSVKNYYSYEFCLLITTELILFITKSFIEVYS